MIEYYAECLMCRKMVSVPSEEAQTYIMFHQIPCNACYHSTFDKS